jgi:hypothetical protein
MKNETPGVKAPYNLDLGYKPCIATGLKEANPFSLDSITKAELREGKHSDDNIDWMSHSNYSIDMSNLQPRTLEEHKMITMSYTDKIKELVNRFKDISNIDLVIDDVSIKRGLDELFGVAVNFQHNYSQTNSHLENATVDLIENATVDLISDIKKTIEDYKRSIETNPHRGKPLTDVFVGSYQFDGKKKPYYITVDLSKGKDC